MQWENFALHWNALVSTYMVSLLANASNSFGLTLDMAAGQTGVSKVLMPLPRSMLLGNSGYDIDVSIDAVDPVTPSRNASGPYYSHTYVGTAGELARFSRQALSQPLGGAVGDNRSFERFVDLTSPADLVRLMLTQGAQIGLNLHIADAAVDGIYTGLLTVTGVDASTGAALSRTVRISVELDRTGPSASEYRCA